YYNNRYADYGITVGQSFVLFHLLDNDGSSVKEIASRVQLDSPALTGIIDRLVREELVERREDPEDRRSLRISLTLKGRKLAAEVLTIAQEYNEQIKDLIKPENLEAFRRSIARLEEGL
ncbi:MAG: MarR family transcriptional regulator, partial [Syntrophomonadaceae bacterium]|nr:MarR family transcriptional regulator [Syntrophomonadaceae bacterium]